MLLALGGCGGSERPDATSTSADSGQGSRLRDPATAGESGTLEERACDLLRPGEIRRALGRPGPPLEGVPNDSLDLSVCDWRGPGVELVKLMVDAAPSAELRFYNQLSEQLEYHNADPAQKPRQIKGVGQDSAYGGAGAWWTRARSQLIAFQRKRIMRLRLTVRGLDDAASRRAAVTLARRAFSRLSGPAS
jgi:hypothetical protein